MKDWIITENDKLKAKELAKQSGIPPFWQCCFPQEELIQ